MKPPARTRVGKCPVSLITMFFLPNPTNVSNISIFCAVQWFELEPCLIQKHFCPTAGGLRCTNGRALRHPSRDFLVPYVTVNGFGRLINRDEWEPIHNPLCTWPGALSVLQDLKKRLSQQRQANYCPLLAGESHWQHREMCIFGYRFAQRQN